MLWVLNVIVVVSVLTMLGVLVGSMALMRRGSPPSRRQLRAIRSIGTVAVLVGVAAIVARVVLN